MVTVLPHPLSPTIPTTWPGCDVEAHPVDRAHDPLVELEGTRRSPDLEGRRRLTGCTDRRRLAGRRPRG